METQPHDNGPVGSPAIKPSVAGDLTPAVEKSDEDAISTTPTVEVVNEGGQMRTGTTMTTPPRSKRKYPNLPERIGYVYGENGFALAEQYFPKHLVIKGDLAKKSVFERGKALKAALGQTGIKGIKVFAMVDRVTKKNYLEVTVKTAHQSNYLLTATTIGGVDVTVEEHEFKNNVYGVFVDKYHDLDNLSPEHVTDGLKDWNDNIVKAEKLGQKSVTWKVTLNSFVVPDRITIALGTSYPMKPFVPQVIRCYNCQGYKHTVKNCKNDSRCQRCGETYEGGHDYKKCKAEECVCTHCYIACKHPPKCVNCDGDHPSGSKECPEQILRKEINRLVFEEAMTWPEAELRAKATVQGRTFAQVTNVRAGPKWSESNNIIRSKPADAAIAERMTNLENMFKDFMEKASQPQNMNCGSTSPEVEALIKKVEKQQEELESVKKTLQDKEKSFADQVTKGYESMEKLKSANEQLKKENEELHNKYRAMMLVAKKETTAKRPHDESPSSDVSQTETKNQKIDQNRSRTKLAFKDSSEQLSASQPNLANSPHLLAPNGSRGGGSGGGGRGGGRGGASKKAGKGGGGDTK